MSITNKQTKTQIGPHLLAKTGQIQESSNTMNSSVFL